MEGPQGGCVAVCERLHGFSAEQSRAYAIDMIIIASTHSRVEMGERINGIYHKSTKSTGQGLHICSG
jgi:hypothetical protein